MEIDIAISGKPGKWGNESIGIDDDSLKTRLYNQCQRDSQVESRLAVSFECIGGESYSYYHYLKPKKVAEMCSPSDMNNNQKHGRTGSYFGLTLKLNRKYCADIKFIYTLLEKMFKKHIDNKILAREDTDGFWVYQIARLSEAQPCIDKIKQDIDTELIRIQDLDLLKPLSLLTDQQVTGKITKLNLNELNQDECFELLMSGEKLYIATEYGIREEKEPLPIDHKARQDNNVSRTIPSESDDSPNISVSDEDVEDESSKDTSINIRNVKWQKDLMKYVAAMAVIGVVCIGLMQFFNSEETDMLAEEQEEKVADASLGGETPLIRIEENEQSQENDTTNMETSDITLLDIKGGSHFVKGEVHKLTAKIGSSPAKGVGKFEVAPNSGIWIHQDSAICAVYVDRYFDGDTIEISYHYRIDNRDTVHIRPVAIENN